jgi:glycosyltransferase involved in cell wall biosynthesis
VANYISFAFSATFFSGPALRDVDAVWVYNSPATVGLPLLWHTRLGAKPFFLHVQDLWPDSLIASGMLPKGWVGRVAVKTMGKLVQLTERKAAVIGVSSHSVKEIILARNPAINPEKIIYAPNPTNEDLFRPVGEIRQQLGIDADGAPVTTVMYAGAIGEVQGLDSLISAAALLTARTDIQITIVGDGISRHRLEERVQKEGLFNVKFMGRVPQPSMPEQMARAHIQFVSLADDSFLTHTTPSKIATLLALGVPIVAHMAGDGARLVRDAKAGVIVAPGDTISLASAIEKMVDAGPKVWARYGERGRRHYCEHLSVSAITATIINSLSKTIQSDGGMN